MRISAALFTLALLHAEGVEHKHKWFFGTSGTATPHVAAPNHVAKAVATSRATAATALVQESDNEDGGEVKAGSTPPLITKLTGILAELKERRDNIQHLEKTATQEKTMLEESKQMHQLASTKKGKRTFERQLHDSEQIYKDTTSMLQDSREEANSAAKALLDEMQKAQALIKKINVEAANLQKDLTHGSNSVDRSAAKEASKT